MERLVAEAFGKARGVMVNSGSSALYLAVELLALAPGDEILTPALTFSTDIAAIVRAGLVPVLLDVTPNTYQVDLARIEDAIGPRTKAMLVPNLIGNCPDWDVLRQIADRHGLQLIEDSCDCLGATLRGTPTGTRSDMSLTSFALSHIITAAGTGGMVLLDDPALVDRALTLRRWGRRSEPKFFGSQKGTRSFFSDLDGIQYDDLFIFDEVGWNFEPSEISAAFGVVQMKKLSKNPGAPEAELRAPDRGPGEATGRLRAAGGDAGDRDRLAHVPVPDPAGVRRGPGRVPETHGGERGRYAHGLERQHRAPAGLQAATAPDRAGRPRKLRSGHGDGADPAVQSRHRRRWHGVHGRGDRTILRLMRRACARRRTWVHIPVRGFRVRSWEDSRG
jgi:hypothetical protein